MRRTFSSMDATSDRTETYITKLEDEVAEGLAMINRAAHKINEVKKTNFF